MWKSTPEVMVRQCSLCWCFVLKSRITWWRKQKRKRKKRKRKKAQSTHYLIYLPVPFHSSNGHMMIFSRTPPTENQPPHACSLLLEWEWSSLVPERASPDHWTAIRVFEGRNLRTNKVINSSFAKKPADPKEWPCAQEGIILSHIIRP